MRRTSLQLLSNKAEASLMLPPPALQAPHRGGGRTMELPLQTETEQDGKMLQTELSPPADAQSIVLPTSSVDFDDVSRIEYDRRSRSEVEDRNKVDPQAADKAFLTGIIKLLNKVRLANRLVTLPCVGLHSVGSLLFWAVPKSHPHHQIAGQM